MIQSKYWPTIRTAAMLEQESIIYEYRTQTLDHR
jgi:hypothetical protein